MGFPGTYPLPLFSTGFLNTFFQAGDIAYVPAPYSEPSFAMLMNLLTFHRTLRGEHRKYDSKIPRDIQHW